jgi:hypothetical protein
MLQVSLFFPKKKKTQTNHSITKKVKEMIGLQREIAKQKYLT